MLMALSSSERSLSSSAGSNATDKQTFLDETCATETAGHPARRLGKNRSAFHLRAGLGRRRHALRTFTSLAISLVSFFS
jgi:hypothetical protein